MTQPNQLLSQMQCSSAEAVMGEVISGPYTASRRRCNECLVSRARHQLYLPSILSTASWKVKVSPNMSVWSSSLVTFPSSLSTYCFLM